MLYFTGRRGIWWAGLQVLACWSRLMAVPFSWGWCFSWLSGTLQDDWLHQCSALMLFEGIWSIIFWLMREQIFLLPSFHPPSLPPFISSFYPSIFSFLPFFLSSLLCFLDFFFFDPELQELIFIFLFLFAKLSLWECLFWCTPLLLMLTERYNCRYLSVSVNLIICTKDILSNTF